MSKVSGERPSVDQMTSAPVVLESLEKRRRSVAVGSRWAQVARTVRPDGAPVGGPDPEIGHLELRLLDLEAGADRRAAVVVGSEARREMEGGRGADDALSVASLELERVRAVGGGGGAPGLAADRGCGVGEADSAEGGGDEGEAQHRLAEVDSLHEDDLGAGERLALRVLNGAGDGHVGRLVELARGTGGCGGGEDSEGEGESGEPAHADQPRRAGWPGRAVRVLEGRWFALTVGTSSLDSSGAVRGPATNREFRPG